MTDVKITSLQLDMMKQDCEELVRKYQTAIGTNNDAVKHIDDTVHDTIIQCLKENGINVYIEPVKNDIALYGRYYLSSIKTPTDTHRSRFIIHRPDLFYLAEFDTKDQLDKFLKMFDMQCTQVSVRDYSDQKGNTYREFVFDKEIYDRHLFWDINELPKDAKPFKATSNGSTVTCYFTDNGHAIEIYRPNANAKNVYDPLSDDERHAFIKENGSY